VRPSGVDDSVLVNNGGRAVPPSVLDKVAKDDEEDVGDDEDATDVDLIESLFYFQLNEN
jgi:hypothetical protein